MNLIFIGPPLSGKGTQSKLIARKFNIPHISTGDMFREAYSSRTELGLKVHEYIAGGDLVPDELTIAVVKERLKRDDCKDGFLLDGFPRTLEQAKALDALCIEIDKHIEKVVSFAIPEQLLELRLQGRIVCTGCGASYHLLNNKPRIAGICDVCNGKVEQREDDNAASLKIRLQKYRTLTSLLLKYYNDKGLVFEVDATSTIENIFDNISKEVSKL